MSGFVALYHPDGRPAERSRIARLLATIAYRGPDGLGAWAKGPIAMGHARLAWSAEGGDGQPLVGDTCAIVFAGRIDNREELMAALHLHPTRCGCDAALVLEAYAEWSEQAASRLLGDFAYAIWDGHRQRLVCARDALGQKPLFYYAAEDLVLVASEPRAILCDAAVPLDIDEGVAAEFLADMPMSREATLNAAVRRLLPAHWLIADSKGCRTQRYWDFDRRQEIRYAKGAEYAEHFADLFSEAVRCRIEGAPSVAVFLSGGIDSSAVVGAALPIARARGTGLTAFALRFPGRACDEGAYIAAVAAHNGIDVREIEMVPGTPESFRAEATAACDVPSYPNGRTFDALRIAARQAGNNVGLTGFGGDEWFTGSTVHTADLLRRGRFVAAWRQLRAEALLPGRRDFVSRLRLALAPLVPRHARSILAMIRPAPILFEWIRPEFQRRVSLMDRLRPQWTYDTDFPTAAQAEIYRVATSAGQLIGDDMEERAAATAGIDQRHPFLDRRIAEFGLALPEEQRWSGTETKIVVRAGMRLVGGVPEQVLARHDKAEFSSSYADALRSFGATAFERLRTEELGWVDGDRVRSMYAQMLSLYTRDDAAYIPLSGALWAVLALDLWLEGRDANRCRLPVLAASGALDRGEKS